jgi:hypothetical protein
MKITKKQLKKMIYECACETMRDMEMPSMPDANVKVIGIKSLPEPAHIHSTLFPGLGEEEHENHEFDDEDDQGEGRMIVNNLRRVADRASELSQLTSEIPDNEEWVQEKIAVASAMIDSIYNYIKYSKDEWS